MPTTHDHSNSWKTKASKLSVCITTNDNKNNNRAITFNKGVILSRAYYGTAVKLQLIYTGEVP